MAGIHPLWVLGMLVACGAQAVDDGAALMKETSCPEISLGTNIPVVSGGHFIPSDNTRYITANHKTGTDYGKCLQMITKDRPDVTPIYKGHNHVEGGFKAGAWQVNMVRDPYVMVDSGYMFHRRSAEWWCGQPLSSHSKGQFSVPWAAEKWNEHFFGDTQPTCGRQSDKLKLNLDTESYAEALQRFPLASGLLLEILRVILFDATVMVNSALSCVRATGNAVSMSEPACINVLLDDVMEAGVAAFDDLLVPQLRLRAKDLDELRHIYMKKCSIESSRAQSHSTVAHVPEAGAAPSGAAHDDLEEEHAHRYPVDPVSNTTRPQRVEMIKHLDQVYLAGTLAKYRETLFKSVHRPSEDDSAIGLKWQPVSSERM